MTSTSFAGIMKYLKQKKIGTPVSLHAIYENDEIDFELLQAEITIRETLDKLRAEMVDATRSLEKNDQYLSAASLHLQRALQTRRSRLEVAQDYASASKAFFQMERCYDDCHMGHMAILEGTAYGTLCALKSMQAYASIHLPTPCYAIGVHAGNNLVALRCYELAVEIFDVVLEYSKMPLGGGSRPHTLVLHCHKNCAAIQVRAGLYEDALVNLRAMGDQISICLLVCVREEAPTRYSQELKLLEAQESDGVHPSQPCGVDVDNHGVVAYLRHLGDAIAHRDSGAILNAIFALQGLLCDPVHQYLLAQLIPVWTR